MPIFRSPTSEEQAAKQQLMIARATAVNVYGGLEQALNGLLAHLLDVPDETAAVIFFRIFSTRPRNNILDELFKKRYQKQYEHFWKSLLKLIRSLDGERNEIIHFHAAEGIDEQNQIRYTLVHPDFWNQPAEVHTIQTIEAFSDKCHFAYRLINMFVLFAGGYLPSESHDANTWREIFLQPVVHPPPNTHPLYRIPTAP